MSMDRSRGVPGIPLAALDSIGDANTREVLRALVDGWHVRNANAGNGDSAFVTRGELTGLRGGGGYGPGGAGQAGKAQDFLRPGDVTRIISDVQAAIFESTLWKQLGERIQLINIRTSAELQKLADDLAAEAATRLGFDEVQGSKIAALEDVGDDHALKISGLLTRVGGAEASIVNLQGTTATQATNLTQLTARTATAESQITLLQTTTANQTQQLQSLVTRTSATEAAIHLESQTRANEDNALANSVSTQFSVVNANLAAIQQTNTTTANSVAALSSSVTTLQASVAGNTTAIQTEAVARVNADGVIQSRYSVKIDTNGYVTGFGLISEANNSAPLSSFIVRADRFAIGSPEGPGIQPAIPFVVLTTAQTINGAVRQPGAYIQDAWIGNAAIDSARIAQAAITSAHIQDLAVDTLKIRDFAVTNPYFDTFSNLVDVYRYLGEWQASYTSSATVVASRTITITAGAAGASGVFVNILCGCQYENFGGVSSAVIILTAQINGGAETILGIASMSLTDGYNGTLFTSGALQSLGACTLTVRFRAAQGDSPSWSNGVSGRYLSVTVVKK